MHTGITIERLIATVARVDAKIENANKVYREILRTSVVPLSGTANQFSRPGVM